MSHRFAYLSRPSVHGAAPFHSTYYVVGLQISGPGVHCCAQNLPADFSLYPNWAFGLMGGDQIRISIVRFRASCGAERRWFSCQAHQLFRRRAGVLGTASGYIFASMPTTYTAETHCIHVHACCIVYARRHIESGQLPGLVTALVACVILLNALSLLSGLTKTSVVI